ncbi:MAG: DNA recombination protein RmuC [Pararhodobacter sp.]
MDLPDLAEIDPLLLGGAAMLAVLVVIAFVWRLGGMAGRARVAALQQALAAREIDLRNATNAANRYEALAAERRAEVAAWKEEAGALRLRLEQEARGQQAQAATISRLQAELRAQTQAAAEKIEILSRVRADMEARFHELAREALKVQGEEFSKVNLERLQATLTPLKEHVGHFERELKAVHKATVDDRAALKAEIMQLSKRSEEVSKEALALTRALKSDQQKQGAWGEMILETILERSGLRAGEEYETQAHRNADDGARLRPDVVVRIPDGKTLVIDSKVSLVAYTEAVNAETEAQAAAARKRHALSLRTHISGLAGKGYQAAEDASVDFVVLFVPIEGALSEALREDGSLTEYALERHVMIATPTTLMAMLRTVANVWAAERRNRNAEEIARRAGLLYDKVAGFVSSMDDVGNRLGQAQLAYDRALGQLARGRGNLLSQVETLKTLGARTTRRLGVDFDDSDTPAPAGDAVEQEEAPLSIPRD